MIEYDDGELGLIVDATMNASSTFMVWGESEPLHGIERFACWLNGWLPCELRLGNYDGRWRFFRV